MRRFLIAIVLLILLSGIVSAEDRLKPVLDSIYKPGREMAERFYDTIKELTDRILSVLYTLFPSLEESIKNPPKPEKPLLEIPVLRELEKFYFLIYLAIFFVAIAILAKLWSLSKRYILNSISGVALLLILIHVFGVEIKVTLLRLIIIALFGIPGALFVLVLHYLGISL